MCTKITMKGKKKNKRNCTYVGNLVLKNQILFLLRHEDRHRTYAIASMIITEGQIPNTG